VMLRDEDNANYRSVIKKTLEFDPDIMKRYVNFMSNPDERTAIDQFGKGDKCFGVAALMATLPGLPMFGHGQIEGFTEKYGMEYYRPRYNEDPDHWLVERHDWEIAPLLKKRWLFAESENFLLYDFFQDSGVVDEHIFAYSNRNGGERALVVYNNRYAATHGTIDWSAAYADKGAGEVRQRRLVDGLGLSGEPDRIVAFRDSLKGLEYLRRGERLAANGLTLDLHAYQCYVFLDWRELRATAEQSWGELCDQLNGAGVASLDDALVGLELRPVHEALRSQLDSGIVRLLADVADHPRSITAGSIADGKNLRLIEERKEFFEQAWRRCEAFLRASQKAYATLAGKEDLERPTSSALLLPVFRERMLAAMRIPAVEAAFSHPWTAAARRVLPSPSPQFTATAMWGPLLGWCVLELLAESIDCDAPQQRALDLFDRLRLREPFAQAFSALGFDGEEGWKVAARIKVVLLSEAGVGKVDAAAVEADLAASDAKEIAVLESESPAPEPELAHAAAAEPVVAAEEPLALPALLWSDPDVRWLTGVHAAEGHEYLVRERYEEMLWWMQMPALLKLAGEPKLDRKAVDAMGARVESALETAEAAGYRIDRLTGTAVEVEPVAVESVEELPEEDAVEEVGGAAVDPEEAVEILGPDAESGDVDAEDAGEMGK